MHWSVNYLGRPFQSGADGPDAYDCWGLVRAVLRDRAGIEVPKAPVSDATNAREVAREFARSQLYADWREIDTPERELDVTLMAEGRYPVHVGLWIPVGRGRVLHAVEAGGVVCVDLTSLSMAGYRVLGWYRHAHLC